MNTDSLSAHEQMLLLSIAAGHKAAGKEMRAWTVEHAILATQYSEPGEKTERALKHARLIISIN